jgi:hypothetical protein
LQRYEYTNRYDKSVAKPLEIQTSSQSPDFKTMSHEQKLRKYLGPASADQYGHPPEVPAKQHEQYVQELKDKLDNPPFLFNGPPDTAVDAETHQHRQEYPWSDHQASRSSIGYDHSTMLPQIDHLAERFKLRGSVNRPDSPDSVHSVQENVEDLSPLTGRKLLAKSRFSLALGKKKSGWTGNRRSSMLFHTRASFVRIHSPWSRRKRGGGKWMTWS